MHVIPFISTAIIALSSGVRSAHYFDTFTGRTSSFCGDTTWQNETSSTAALASDCQKIADQLRQHEKKAFELYGWKEDSTDEYLGLSTVGSCVFGAKVIHNNNALPVIANGDIADIIRDAMSHFEVGGRIGASGSMQCKPDWGDYFSQEIGWRIYTYPS
ncbi:putative necrosis-inducing factor-domain-containing protein [Xylaria grammica]|nr:putative necrosis-inducing factor-domain-containing protein [Xylaria grammica]